VGGSGTILHSADGGSSFRAQSSGTTSILDCIGGSGPGDVHAAGSIPCYTLHSTDHGSSWTQVSHCGSSGTIYGVWGDGRGNAVIVGDGGYRNYTWSNGQWLDGSDPDGHNLYAVWGASLSDVFAVGQGGAIVHSGDGGSTFVTLASLPGVGGLFGVSGSGSRDVYAIGAAGLVLHATDGASFAPVSTGSSSDLHAIWAEGGSDVFAVGGGGTILRSADHGATWTAEPSGTTASLYAIFRDAQGQVMVAGDGGTLLRRR
jgi:photosystem II stability/assembly factor-like uncharacterized protein